MFSELRWRTMRFTFACCFYSHDPMIKGTFPVDRFQTLDTPFYYYDMELLRATPRYDKEGNGKPAVSHPLRLEGECQSPPTEAYRIIRVWRRLRERQRDTNGPRVWPSHPTRYSLPVWVKPIRISSPDLNMRSPVSTWSRSPELEVMNCLAGTVNKKARVAPAG